MKTKKMSTAQGESVNIDQFPNFHRTGSVTGMKKLYYGKNALLVRCGAYIYKVSEEVYNKAR